MYICELGSGKYSDCFKVWDARCAVACKVSYYQEATIRAFARHAHTGDSGAAHEAKERDAISVATAMAEVARQMKALHVSPHFVHVFCEADVRHLPLRLHPLLRARLRHLTHDQMKYSHACVMELFACNLTTYLTRASDAGLRVVLFQIVYTLACLQAALPGFRHNDLSSNNVLLKPVRPRRAKYTFGTMCFLVHVPFTAALTDFDFTHVPGHIVLSNERIISGKYGIHAEPNTSYDMYVLLRSVLPAARKCKRASAFLRSLHVAPRSPDLVPATLLGHPYFDALRIQPGDCPHDVAYALES